jgi:hypothetical protein
LAKKSGERVSRFRTSTSVKRYAELCHQQAQFVAIAGILHLMEDKHENTTVMGDKRACQL